MIPIHHGIINRGKVVLDAPSRYLSQISNLEGKRVELVVRQEKSERSIRQNKYYWKIPIQLIADYSGHDPDEIHELCKSMFLKTFIVINGKEVASVGSTTRLNTQQFEEYLDRVRAWAAMELNVFIPLPNAVEY